MLIVNKNKTKNKLGFLLNLLIYFLFFLIFLGCLFFLFTFIKSSIGLYKNSFYDTPVSVDEISISLKNECYSEKIKKLTDNGILINNSTLSRLKDNCDQREIIIKNHKNTLKGE